MKLLPPADYQLFEAHRLDKRAYLCRLLRRLKGGYQALSRERRIAKVHWFAHARVELETMYAGWLAPAKRVAGSSDLTVTPNH